MRALVCVKQILDPEIPARDFRIDHDRLEADPGGADLVPNIFCENAIETALQLREAAGGSVVALSFGAAACEEVLRKALAMTVDEAVMVTWPPGPAPDPITVSRVLAEAIRRLGDFDIVMVGRESGDWGLGQTGGLLAEELDLPMVALVDSVEIVEGRLVLRRQSDAGYDTIEAAGPVLVTVTNCDQNVPRIPKTRDVMKSYRKPITSWTVDELGVAPGVAAAEVVALTVPDRSVSCELVEGDSLDDRIDAFARRISEVMSAVG
jgi:electron transfer flavoprotein beta subunit